MMGKLFVSAALLVLPVLFAAPAFAECVRYDRVVAGGNGYGVADVDLKCADLKLYWKSAGGDAYESLANLRADLKAAGKTMLMATNSGIYSQQMTPLGLHVERGKTLQALNKSHASKGNFFINPNGVFLITDKGAQVVETSEYAKVKGPVLEASQSGPLLLRRGQPNPRFKEGSENKKLRSGVGVNADGHAVFAISEGAVGFMEFANFFKENLRCQDALYLDGTISALIAPGRTSEMQLAPYTGIWAATRRD